MCVCVCDLRNNLINFMGTFQTDTGLVSLINRNISGKCEFVEYIVQVMYSMTMIKYILQKKRQKKDEFRSDVIDMSGMNMFRATVNH